MKTAFALFALAAIAAPQSGDASISDLVCDDSARIERQLSGPNGSAKLARGIRGPDAVLEIWVAPSSGDWTLVQAYANGTSCIVAIGEHWEPVSPGRDPA